MQIVRESQDIADISIQAEDCILALVKEVLIEALSPMQASELGRSLRYVQEDLYSDETDPAAKVCFALRDACLDASEKES